MATRQHYLPRFLLRGFCSRESKGSQYVWVHTSSRRAYETNIENVGVEAGFYDLDGDNSVDGHITQNEGQLGFSPKRPHRDEWPVFAAQGAGFKASLALGGPPAFAAHELCQGNPQYGRHRGRCLSRSP